MAKSITDLMIEKAARPEPLRQTRIYRATVGEGQKHIAETQALVAENDEIIGRHEAEQEGRPRKGGEIPSLPPRAIEIRDRLAELADLMGEYEGDLTITKTRTDGEWAQWCIEHPALDEDAPGAREDAFIGGVCSAVALYDDLATYVTHWEGEPLPEGGFDAFELGRPDKRAIAQTVVSMYEVGANLPKLRSGLRMLLASGPFSPSPEPSASASDASTATNLPSDTTTSTPTATSPAGPSSPANPSGTTPA